MSLRDDVDDTRHCVAPVECALRPLYDLYAFNIVRVDNTQVVFATYVAVDAFAIDENKNIGIAQAAQLHLAAHITLGKGKGSGEPAQYFLYALSAKAIEFASRNDLRLHRRILQQVLGPSTCNDDLLDGIRTECHLCHHHRNGTQ